MVVFGSAEPSASYRIHFLEDLVGTKIVDPTSTSCFPNFFRSFNSLAGAPPQWKHKKGHKGGKSEPAISRVRPWFCWR
jgi:hypothetical protein